jgi:hypothetical protein
MEITEGEWLQKDTPRTRIDLVHATGGKPAPGVELLGRSGGANRWVLSPAQPSGLLRPDLYGGARQRAERRGIGGWPTPAEGIASI